MILSAYERTDSPFVRIQYADATGKKRYLKTTIRKDDADKARKVAIALNHTEAQLLNSSARTTGGGWHWVPGWLAAKYRAGKTTLRTYQAQWKWLALYLRLHELSEPGLLEREHCFAYIEWRTSPVKEKSRRHVSINTALNELKLLGLLMDEGVTRGLAVNNPARKLGIQREETEPKPEITNEELALIFPALTTRPVWMQRSFFLALNTGLRFATTALHRDQVKTARNEIVIEKPKGGRAKAFAIALYPEIEPLIARWLKSGEPWLWHLPPKELDFASLVWTKFFREIGLPHLCFHCTRVTFITRGALGGVPEAMMMKLVNHASVEVHRIYQRLAVGNALKYRTQIAIPHAGVAIA